MVMMAAEVGHTFKQKQGLCPPPTHPDVGSTVNEVQAAALPGHLKESWK